jgi:hypothetical protein
VEFSIRPSAHERYSVAPQSLRMRPGESLPVTVRLRLVKFAHTKRAQQQGQRDVLHIRVCSLRAVDLPVRQSREPIDQSHASQTGCMQGQFFDQKVFSTFFLAADPQPTAGGSQAQQQQGVKPPVRSRTASRPGTPGTASPELRCGVGMLLGLCRPHQGSHSLNGLTIPLLLMACRSPRLSPERSFSSAAAGHAEEAGSSPQLPSPRLQLRHPPAPPPQEVHIIPTMPAVHSGAHDQAGELSASEAARHTDSTHPYEEARPPATPCSKSSPQEPSNSPDDLQGSISFGPVRSQAYQQGSSGEDSPGAASTAFTAHVPSSPSGSVSLAASPPSPQLQEETLDTQLR